MFQSLYFAFGIDPGRRMEFKDREYLEEALDGTGDSSVAD